MTRLVILESPYSGDIERNLAYARRAMRDCLARDEAPFASHMLYTQPGVLDDGHPYERQAGIEAGLAWGAKADATVVYDDLGITSGMRYGIETARKAGRHVELRRFGDAAEGELAATLAVKPWLAAPTASPAHGRT